jgi:hypothetical protein
MSSPHPASRSRLLGGFTVLLAACPPPVASEDTGDALTGSTSTTSTGASDSASNTGATPTSDVDPTSTGAPSPATTDATDTTLGVDTNDTTDTTLGVDTNDTTDTTLGVDTTTGDTSTGIASDPGTTADASSTGSGVEPPPGCDLAVVHVGDLAIADDTVMADLQCIVEVTGRLTIKDTKTLVSFAALGNLKRVGHEVEVSDNLALVDLDGLAALERVDGKTYPQLKIHHNPALTDVTGLKSLRRVDSLRISRCDALTDLTGLTGDIDGILAPTWGLTLADNAGLTDLAGLGDLIDLDGHIYIFGNTQLTDISTLSTVLSPTIEHIAIGSNPALQDLQGLDLVVAPRSLYLTDNDSLVDLTGLDSVQTIVPNGLLVEGHAQLASLDGLDAVTTVAELVIEDNPKLTSLATLANLTHVPLVLTIGRCGGSGNDALIDLHGLEGLVAVNALRLNENDALQSIDALPHDIGLNGSEVFNNPLLPHAEIVDYVTVAGISQNSDLCNNGGMPAVCECIVLTD